MGNEDHEGVMGNEDHEGVMREPASELLKDE